MAQEKVLNISLNELKEDLEPMEKLNIRFESLAELNYEQKKEYYRENVSSLSKEAVLDQVNQVLNYAHNTFQTGVIPIYTLIQNMTLAMEEYSRENIANQEMELKNKKD